MYHPLRASTIESNIEKHQTGAAAEIEKVRAAPHRHVLAMVDRFAAGRVFKGTGPSAEPPLGFEQCDFGILLGQGDGRRHPGQSPTNDDNSRAASHGIVQLTSCIRGQSRRHCRTRCRCR